MKSIKLSYLSAICAIAFVLFSISSCKSDYQEPVGIFGTWKTYNNLTQIQRSVTFKADSTSVYTSSKVDNNGHILYDLYRKEAKYSLDIKNTGVKKLTFYNTVTYLNQDYENSPSKSAYVQSGQQNMVATPGTTTTVHSFFLSDGVMNLSTECSGTYTPTCYVAGGGYTRQ
jgi:hypothetical protein